MTALFHAAEKTATSRGLRLGGEIVGACRYKYSQQSLIGLSIICEADIPVTVPYHREQIYRALDNGLWVSAPRVVSDQ